MKYPIEHLNGYLYKYITINRILTEVYVSDTRRRGGETCTLITIHLPVH